MNWQARKEDFADFPTRKAAATLLHDSLFAWGGRVISDAEFAGILSEVSQWLYLHNEK